MIEYDTDAVGEDLMVIFSDMVRDLVRMKKQ